MAKNCIRWLIILCTTYCYSSCVFENGRTDTDRLTEVGATFTPDSIKPLIVADTIKVKQTSTTKIITVIQPTFEQLASIVRKVYLAQIGVRELTGNNDGKYVEIYLRSVGLSKGNPWCAAFVHYCLARGGVSNSISGYAPTSLDKNNLVMYGRRFYVKPHYADVVSFYFPSKHRISHTAFFDEDMGNGFYKSVEGNTGGGGAIGNIVRDGDGVYMMKRSYNATYAISRRIKTK